MVPARQRTADSLLGQGSGVGGMPRDLARRGVSRGAPHPIARRSAAPRLLRNAPYCAAAHLLCTTAAVSENAGRRLFSPSQCSIRMNSGAVMQKVDFYVFF